MLIIWPGGLALGVRKDVRTTAVRLSSSSNFSFCVHLKTHVACIIHTCSDARIDGVGVRCLHRCSQMVLVSGSLYAPNYWGPRIAFVHVDYI